MERERETTAWLVGRLAGQEQWLGLATKRLRREERGAHGHQECSSSNNDDDASRRCCGNLCSIFSYRATAVLNASRINLDKAMCGSGVGEKGKRRLRRAVALGVGWSPRGVQHPGTLQTMVPVAVIAAIASQMGMFWKCEPQQRGAEGHCPFNSGMADEDRLSWSASRWTRANSVKNGCSKNTIIEAIS